MSDMARSATTTDAFSAVAEASRAAPRRHRRRGGDGRRARRPGRAHAAAGLQAPRRSCGRSASSPCAPTASTAGTGSTARRCDRSTTGCALRAHLEHPPRPARRPPRRAPDPGGRTTMNTTPPQPPRLRRRHAPERHRDRHHPAVRAPAELLFRAYTTPELVRRWWGFETSEWLVCDIDLRVGGAWRYVIREQAEPSRSASTASTGRSRARPARDDRGLRGHARTPAPLDTVVFEEVDGVTTMTMTVHPHVPGAPRRPHRLGHGGRHAGLDGPPRGRRPRGGCMRMGVTPPAAPRSPGRRRSPPRSAGP